MPLTIGPRNAVEMTGVSWRWLRDSTRRLGVPIWRVGGKSVIPTGPLLQALEREAASEEPRVLNVKKSASNCAASWAWNVFHRDRPRGSLRFTMPKRPSGHFRWTGSVAVARVRISNEAREGFAMPTCRTDAEARERAQVLASVAERLRLAGVEIDRTRKTLEMVAIAAPRQLSNALAVAAELVGGELRPKGLRRFPPSSRSAISGRAVSSQSSTPIRSA